MDAATFATRTTVATHLRALAQMGRPQMDVNLKAHASSSVQGYSTLDCIEGEVMITAMREARFDRLEIIFEGKVIFPDRSTISNDC